MLFARRSFLKQASQALVAAPALSPKRQGPASP
jgi:hypothetical protein